MLCCVVLYLIVLYGFELCCVLLFSYVLDCALFFGIGLLYVVSSFVALSCVVLFRP